MIGKRLYKLLQELNASQSKRLLHYVKISSDKRLHVLSKLIKNRHETHEKIIERLNKELGSAFSNTSKKEFDHMVRRICDYYCTEIENIIILDVTEKDSKIRAKILSDYFNEAANPYLSDYYLNNGYDSALKEEDLLLALHFGSKLITLSYSKYSINDFKEGLKINENVKNLSENLYINKQVEYFSHVSNMFLENYTLINHKPDFLKNEIEKTIPLTKDVLQTIDLRISQMRLSYNQPDYEKYIHEVEKLIGKIGDNNISHLNTKKKYYYMKLIYGFFTGKNPQDLLELTSEILRINEKTKHVDSTLMWYKVILQIITNNLSSAKENLTKPKYFKLDYLYLKEFLIALMEYQLGDQKKFIPVLNNLVNSKNYFIGQFSLLLLIRYHIIKGNDDLSISLIQSGMRQLKLHPEKFIINNSTLAILEFYKLKAKGALVKAPKLTDPLCCFHEFVLNIDNT